MLKYVAHTDIDFNKWNDLIANSDASYIYGYSWYLDAVCNQWDAIILNDYEAVLPVPKKSKLGISICYQPFFHQSLEIVSKKPLSADLQKSFYELLASKFKVQLFRTHTELSSSQKWKYQILNLNKKEEEIESGYSSNVKRMIKKAQKSALKVEKSSDVLGFVNYFKSEVGHKLGFEEVNYQHLQSLIQKTLDLDKGEIYSVIDEQSEVLATGVFLKEKNKVIYLKGASNEQGRKSGAMHFLMDFAIKKYNTDFTEFDFGGSNVDSIASFYQRFGGEDVFYYSIDQIKGKWIEKLIRNRRSK